METKECICVICKNLKSIFKEDGEPAEYTCQFGFPSQACEDNCLDEDCDLTCNHFISQDEKDVPTIVNCSKCGKTLSQASSNSEGGTVYCIDCFLAKK